jgi:hypothetical protein
MYCVAGWLLVQIATQVFPFFDISNAAVRWVVLAVIAGLLPADAGAGLAVRPHATGHRAHG